MSFSANLGSDQLLIPSVVWTAPSQWYAVHTRSNFEKRVTADLEEKGVENYLPAQIAQHQWKDRRKTITSPLFPGYVFCRIEDTPQARLPVLRTPGVVRILGSGGNISPVPDVQIDAIRRVLQSDLPCFPHTYLRHGSAVRVKSGPLRGIAGVLVQTKSKTRLVLSVELLCQSVAAEVDAADVEALSFT